MSNKPPTPSVPPLPPISVPELPTRSGAWLGTRTHILEKDIAFIKAHADFNDARARQSSAFLSLLAVRMRIARTMVDIAALPEICRREQAQTLRMRAIKNETDATEAAIALADARRRLSDAVAGVKPSAPKQDATSISVDEVETVLMQFPEIDTDNVGKISLLLRALIKEKSV